LLDLNEDYGAVEEELVKHGELLEEGNIMDHIWNTP
jgi:hypothetical protein